MHFATTTKVKPNMQQYTSSHSFSFHLKMLVKPLILPNFGLKQTLKVISTGTFTPKISAQRVFLHWTLYTGPFLPLDGSVELTKCTSKTGNTSNVS